MRQPNTEETKRGLGSTMRDDPRAPLSLIRMLLYSVLMAVAPAASAQAPMEVLHVQELETGFHFLYELKVEAAHTQFATWQKLHPEDPFRGVLPRAS